MRNRRSLLLFAAVAQCIAKVSVLAQMIPAWQPKTDVNTFLTQLREFYGNGVPNDSDFNAITADVQRAFNVFAAHWGGNTVWYRYDFFTLLRVAKQYLPQPYNPRPTGCNWYFRVTNATP